jgi:hypothetical protein
VGRYRITSQRLLYLSTTSNFCSGAGCDVNQFTAPFIRNANAEINPRNTIIVFIINPPKVLYDLGFHEISFVLQGLVVDLVVLQEHHNPPLKDTSFVVSFLDV